MNKASFYKIKKLLFIVEKTEFLFNVDSRQRTTDFNGMGGGESLTPDLKQSEDGGTD